jgi:uncharacterized protein YjbI with pentapeptide repeats
MLKKKSEQMQEVYHIDKEFKNIAYTDNVISEREFVSCIFENCVLTKLTFEDCYFENCVFKDSDLTMMNVKGSSFRDVKFEGCKILGVLWDEVATPIMVNFDECALSFSSFFGLSLKKIKIEKCIAKEVNFSEADLTQASFKDSDLGGSVFLNTNLNKANFESAHNYFLNINSNKIKGALFSMPEVVSLLTGLGIKIKL